VSDTAEYIARIKSHAQSKDPLEMQKQTPVVLEEFLARASNEQLTTRPGPDKWSVGEIIAHLAEDEIVTTWRYRQMVENSGVHLPGFDQDLWARVGDYASRAPQESLALFRLLRNANLQFLRNLSPEEWESAGVHSERGPMTVRSLATHMAGHDANHIEQIRKILG
jgi:hypothetical protein